MQRLESEERLGRRERLGSVRGLVRTVEGQEDVIHRAVRAAQPKDLPGHGELPVDDTEVDALALRQRPHLGASGKQDLGGLETLPGEDGVRARLDDPGLLAGDLGDGTAQQVGVIKIDWGDHRNLRIGHIGGVPGPAQADLHDRDVDRCVGKGGVRHRRDDLEEGHRDAVDLAFVDECNVRLDLSPHIVEALIADRLPVDGDAFCHARRRAGW